MAQRRAFETDFRKDANLRKVWDDIVTGGPQWRLPPEAGLAGFTRMEPTRPIWIDIRCPAA